MSDQSVDKSGKVDVFFSSPKKINSSGGSEYWTFSRKVKMFLYKYILPGRVSRVHYHEARERYFTLKRRVEFFIDMSLPGPKINWDEIWNTEECGICNRIQQQMESMEDEDKERLTVLCRCVECLVKDQELLSRRQDHLNRLWRSLTRVQKLLVKHIYNNNELASQLEVCREEAFRLRCEGDPAIVSLIERIAELNDEKGLLEQTELQFRRAINAAFERFTSIRTKRIHDQYINVRAYMWALIVVIPTSCCILANHQNIIKGMDKKDTDVQIEISDTPKDVSHESFPSVKESVAWYDYFNKCIKNNVLAFVFFGGFTGGLFSVVTRTRSREMLPGEDAYFTWYVLTKPLVGAFGAMIIFILIGGGLLRPEILVKMEMVANAQVFGFSLIAGFSERIIFPDFR